MIVHPTAHFQIAIYNLELVNAIIWLVKLSSCMCSHHCTWIIHTHIPVPEGLAKILYAIG